MCAAVNAFRGEDAREQRVLGELPHLDGVLERRAISADARGVDRAGDGDDLEIDRRRETSVQLQLSIAIEMAGGQPREIQEAQIDSLLDLVGMAACQQDVRNMGFDDANRRASGAVQGRIRQRSNEARLVVCAGDDGVRHGVHPGDFTSNHSNWQATRLLSVEQGNCRRRAVSAPEYRQSATTHRSFPGSNRPICPESDLQASDVVRRQPFPGVPL